jgi:ribosomal protein L16 Arg81 hydroxylase
MTELTAALGPDNDDEEKEEEQAKKKQKLDDLPPSFCQVPVEALHDETLAKKYPTLKKATKVTFELKPGEVLYLPAGWFHEVTSFGTKKDKTHLALNYWLAPPVTKNPQAPYMDDFWKETRMDPIIQEIEALQEEQEDEDEDELE